MKIAIITDQHLDGRKGSLAFWNYWHKFYNEIFPWLFKCEKAFVHCDLSGYNKARIYGFLAERFMSYWFKKNTKFITSEMCKKTLSLYRDIS